MFTCSSMLLLLASVANSEVVEIDQTAHAPVVSSDYTPIPSGGAIDVLWDTTHGVEFDYEPEGRFAGLVALLSPMGYDITTTDAGIDNIDLSTLADGARRARFSAAVGARRLDGSQ